MRHKLWFVISSMISYIPSPLRLNEDKFTHHLRCLLISAMMFCVDRRVGKKRLFTTWCNRSISLMMGVKILIIIWNMIYYYFLYFFFRILNILIHTKNRKKVLEKLTMVYIQMTFYFCILSYFLDDTTLFNL